MWRIEDTEGAHDVSRMLVAQTRARRKVLLLSLGGLLAAVLVVWAASGIFSSVARKTRAHERWLEQNECVVTSHREPEWDYHWIGDYYERVSGETCYRCAKTGETFCETE